MPQFLTTIKTSAAIEDIIKKAKKRIVLISPYLKISKQLNLRLIEAAKKNVPITVIYGKTELKNEELTQLSAIKGLKLMFLKDLHAKCYFNEDELIVTSMNMYEFSEKTNHEMGVLFSAIIDKDIYDEVVEEAAIFARNATGVFNNTTKTSSDLKETRHQQSTQNISKQPEKDNVKNEIAQLLQKNVFTINKSYKRLSNFHFHSLYTLLSNEHPGYNKQLNHFDYDPGLSITIENYPIRGTELLISGSIKFIFEDVAYFKQMKKRLKGTFENKVPSANFYWNHRDLNIVTEDERNFKVSEDGLKQKLAHYLEIIKITSAAFKNCN